MTPAVPASSRPAPKAAIPAVSAPSGPRRSDHCPASTIPNRLVVKYPENAKAYNDTPSSSRAATGMAVPTAVASKAMSSTTETIPTLRARYALLSTVSPTPATRGTSALFATPVSRGSRTVMAASVRATTNFDPCRETGPAPGPWSYDRRASWVPPDARQASRHLLQQQHNPAHPPVVQDMTSRQTTGRRAFCPDEETHPCASASAPRTSVTRRPSWPPPPSPRPLPRSSLRRRTPRRVSPPW